MDLSLLSIMVGLALAAVSLVGAVSTADPDLRARGWYGAALGLLCAGIGVINMLL